MPAKNYHISTTAQDYYPFGMPMPRLYGPANSTYRFGFNGQEKTDEIAGFGNHNTAQFWEYDTRTGRRWNLDPKPQISISDYATFANNPIWFSDPLGDIWDPENNSEEQANYFIKNVENERNRINKKLNSSNLNAVLKNDLNNRIAKLDQSLLDIEKMKNSPIIYWLEPIFSDPNEKILKNFEGKLYEEFDKGKTFYDLTNKKVVMQYDGFSTEARAHEIFHGMQFENGEISFNIKSGLKGMAYDPSDEVNAWNFGQIFDANLNKPLILKTTADIINLKYTFINKDLNAILTIYNTINDYRKANSQSLINNNNGQMQLKDSKFDITK